jgi:hypothetical protein
MAERDLRNIPDTRLYLSGVDFNVTRSENISRMKREGIRQVFMLFPLTQKQLDEGDAFKGKAPEMKIEDLYAKMGLDIHLATILPNEGIRVSSLLRNPSSLRDYESFNREAREAKGKIMIQCIHGRHASASYAMYYLARSTSMSLAEIRDRLMRTGLTGRDLMRVEEFLGTANVSLRRVIEHREKERMQREKRSKKPKTGKHKKVNVWGKQYKPKRR